MRNAIDDAERLRRKAATFVALKEEYQTLKAGWGGYAGYDRWFAEPLSNAHLASVATYHDLVPAFRTLLARAGSFAEFYAACGAGAEDHEQRQRQLALLAEPQAPLAERHRGRFDAAMLHAIVDR